MMNKNNYKLIKYNDEYFNYVYDVKKNAYKKYVEENWGTWDDKEQRKLFDKFIDTYFNCIYIIQLNGVNIGFYNGQTLDYGTYEIGNICIIPEYQGKGIGSQILKDIIEMHKNQTIKLQYFKQNPVGSLYEKLGFTKDTEKEYHYTMIKRK